MVNTRFMEVMFSNNDEELANQVDNDIRTAQEKGEVDTDEVKYENLDDGSVAITDKENGEVTLAKRADDVADTYDLVAVPDGELERYLHPTADGHIGNQTGAPDWRVDDHFVEGNEGDEEETEREFSVYSDNVAVQRIFEDQLFCERIFSEVIESEETAVIGDLKVEKLPDEDGIVVTSESTGDQAKVEFDGDSMEVTELAPKNFTEEQYEPLRVVGVDPVDHVLVDAPEYSQESAEELARRLTEDGVECVRIFDNPEDARDYAIELLDGLGVESTEDIEEPEQVEYSDHDIYLTQFYADNNYSMVKMFSEVVNGVSGLHDTVSDAIESGDQVETEEEIITPVDAVNAVIEDKQTGEFTKVTLSGEDARLENISPEEAEDITGNLSVIESESSLDNHADLGDSECCDEDEEDEEKEFSDIYCDEYETRFFSEYEEMTNYMVRLFSMEADQTAIEDAIQNGDQIETDTEVITPVDSKTAVVEDKETGEFTKVTTISDDALNVHPIDDQEADELTENLAVAPGKDEENALAEEEGEIKNYSDIYTNEAETRFFSEYEEMTDYMVRLYSEEADQEDIEDAIQNGDQIENDDEVITPVDSKTAVIEDKETGEFTKAIIKNEDEIDVHPIDKEEADELTKNLAVEDTDEDEDEKEKKYSNTLDKFFTEAVQAQAAPAQAALPQPKQPVAQVEAPVQQEVQAPTVEEVEDKAIAAVESIKAAADAASATILEAKAAPAQVQEPDLQEAQFSERMFSETQDTLVSWLINK